MTQEETTNLGRELEAALEEVAAHVRGERPLPSRMVQVPEQVEVATIRHNLGLSQREFAERFGFSVAALRDWEQGRRRPDRSARILLLLIDREAEAVERALAQVG